MAIKINGHDLSKRMFNGVEVSKVMKNWLQIRPEVVEHDYLCFTALEANSTVQFHKYVTLTNTFEISYNKTDWELYRWNDFQGGYEWPVITLANVWDKVYWRSTSETPTEFSYGMVNNYRRDYTFTMSGSIAASGNIMYLLCKYGADKITNDHCFERLFDNCTALVTPPRLPSTTLKNSCYLQMFQWCTSLTTTPVLPATRTMYICYGSMFANCTSLTTLPELPATFLRDYCYMTMFSGCTWIKLSETQTWEYQTPYRIPTTWTWTQWTSPLDYMFYGTWWTFTWTPTITTTYYTSNTIIS